MSEETKKEASVSDTENKVGKKELTKSAKKRLDRQKEIKAAKKKANLESIISWTIGVAIAVIFVGAIGMGIYYSVDAVAAANNYSACLTEDGFIEGANLSKVKDLDMENLVIDMAEVEYTDEEVQEEIDEFLEDHTALNDSPEAVAKDGDTVSITYAGYMDGVAFEGGTSDTPSDLVLGSQSFIDDFEQQIEGHHPGDTFDVNVTFPDEYESSPDLAGKDARFEVVLYGVYETPELTDELVSEHFEYATVDEYKAALKDNGLKANLEEYISQYISDNAKTSSYPRKYVKNLRSIIRYSDEQSFAQYNTFAAYYGMAPYASFNEYTGLSDREYQKKNKADAKKATAANLTFEKIFVENNLTISEETIADKEASYSVETYGSAFLRQLEINQTVLDYLKGVVSVK